jgi:hypothetical protein
MNSPPPQSPGKGLKWVEVNDAMIAQEIERALEHLALQMLRDPDPEFRRACARDWPKVEEAVRAGYHARYSHLQDEALRAAAGLAASKLS